MNNLFLKWETEGFVESETGPTPTVEAPRVHRKHRFTLSKFHPYLRILWSTSYNYRGNRSWLNPCLNYSPVVLLPDLIRSPWHLYSLSPRKRPGMVSATMHQTALCLMHRRSLVGAHPTSSWLQNMPDLFLFMVSVWRDAVACRKSCALPYFTSYK